MHFLFVQRGTAGDVYPFLAVAVELKRRGRRISFLTNTHFAALIREHGLEFADLGRRSPWRSPNSWPLGSKSVLFTNAGQNRQFRVRVAYSSNSIDCSTLLSTRGSV